MDEELKALLAKAQENFDAQAAKAAQADVRLKDAENKNQAIAAEFKAQKEIFETAAKKHAEEIDQLKNQIADFEVKFKGGLVITDQKEEKEKLTLAFKNAVGSFMKVKTANASSIVFKDYVEGHIKAALNLTTTGQGLESIDEVLSREIIERARETYPIIGAVGSRNMPRSLREEVLISYPSVQQGIENVAGTTISQTEVQRYAEVVNQVAKVNAKPRITDEAMVGGDLDLYGHLLRLLNDEIGRYLVNQILYGNGGSKNMRGILSSSRFNITNLTGESFKPTIAASGARNPDFYPALGTGVSGNLPANDVAIVNWLVDLETELPTAYLNGAKWYMNRRTLARFKKVRDADERPIFASGYMGEPMSILGYPVVVDDYMPDIAVNAPFLIFGKLNEAFYISPGDIDSMLIDPYTVDGCTVVKVNKEYFEIVGKNDAIIIGAATTAGAA